MKNEEIINLYETLEKIDDCTSLTFPIEVSFALAKNKHILNPIYTAVMDTRQKIILENGIRNEDNTYTIPNEKIEKVNNDLRNLYNLSSEVNLNYINVNTLEGKISLKFMEGLLPILR